MTGSDLLNFETIEQFHEMSMSHDPTTAGIGRFLKFVAPSLAQYVEEEGRRRSKKNDVASSYVHGVVLLSNMFSQFLLDAEEEDVNPNFLRELGDHISVELKSYADFVESHQNAK